MSLKFLYKLFFVAVSCNLSFALYNDFSRRIDDELYTAFWLKRFSVNAHGLENSKYPNSFRGVKSIKQLPEQVLKALNDLSMIADSSAKSSYDYLQIQHVLNHITSHKNLEKMVESVRLQPLDCARK